VPEPGSRHGHTTGAEPPRTRVNSGSDARPVVSKSSAPPSRRGGRRDLSGPRQRWTPVAGGARRLVGLAEAATYLGVSPWTVRSLQWDGRLPRVNLSRRLLFDLADLDRLVETEKERPR
jgi:hypothetical protein